jgi:S-adenosylmethionine/arginine decarboxylase-like enzyme
MDCLNKEAKGCHVFMDITNFFITNLEDEATFIFETMKKAITSNSQMKIMGEQMVILKDDTEEGFTSCLLLDESHFTSHAYTKKGLLAFDIFTCGSANSHYISCWFMCQLQKKYPDIQVSNYQVHTRFLTTPLNLEAINNISKTT